MPVSIGGSSTCGGGGGTYSGPFAFEKWSSGSQQQRYTATSAFTVHSDTMPSQVSGSSTYEPSLRFGYGTLAKLCLQRAVSTGGMHPPRSQIRRSKMAYHCKFGEFGVMEGQFTEPSGVAVGPTGDLVVADTNNHRIQVGTVKLDLF